MKYSGLPGFINLLLHPVNLLYGVIIVAAFGILYLVSLQNYILFHGIVELAGIAVAFSIFIIVWNTRRNINDAFFLIIGISFLFIGGLDLVHTLAYKGMGVFPGNSADLPTQLWIAARYFQSITFLIATLFIGRSITRDRNYDAAIIVTACAASCALILASIFIWQVFPQCFIEGSGLTPFKIASEYAISLILVITIAVLYQKRDKFDPLVWKLLIAAQFFLILGELAFTSYISVYGFMNMLGHLFRLLSVYLIYRAFVVVALTRPYDLLLRDLKQNEIELRQSKEKFSDMIESLQEGIWIIDQDAITTYVNRRMAEILGYEADEMLGKHLFSFMDNDEITTAETYLMRRKQGIREQHDFIFRKKDGTRVITSLETSPLFSHEGKYIGASAAVADISERRKAEDALKASERKYRTLFENMLEGFAYCRMIYDDEGRPADWVYLDVNAAFGRLTGLKDIVGKRVLEAIPGIRELNPELFETYGRVASTGVPETFEIDFIPLKMWLKVSVFSPEKGYFVAVFDDISERKRAEDAIQQVNKKLNLLSSITRHDINNQLFSIKAYLELSKESIENTAQLSEYLIKIERSAAAIERQISFTKEYQDLGVKAPIWQSVDACVKNAQAALPMRDIRIDAGGLEVEIFCDPLLEKVFYNLIDNALRYGGPQMSKITISSQVSDRGLVITVEDNGSGISAEDKERLFKRGFGRNTGLGLFLSREILSITGITIIENGEPGKGARFEITVPRGSFRPNP